MQPELKGWDEKNKNMEVVITVLIIIVSIVMALFVLIQNPKGGGLASGFSGASQIGGVQKTADFLEKGSWAMMIALFQIVEYRKKSRTLTHLLQLKQLNKKLR